VDKAKPLHNRHYEIYTGAHIIGCETAHEGIKLRGRRADSEEEGDFNEDDDERACTAGDGLATCCARLKRVGYGDVQAECTEENQNADMEEIRDSNCETEQYADNSGPAISCQPRFSEHTQDLLVVSYCSSKLVGTSAGTHIEPSSTRVNFMINHSVRTEFEA
jgi:hypothetical protein